MTMKSKLEVGDVLEEVCREVRIPRLLVTEGTKEEQDRY